MEGKTKKQILSKVVARKPKKKKINIIKWIKDTEAEKSKNKAKSEEK